MRLQIAAFVGALLLLAGPALAQKNPFQGFSSNSGEPIGINSANLEVRQNERKAIFSGNVVATQGKSTLRASQLIVYYDAAEDGTQGGVNKIEATGGITVVSEDQSATGRTGVFDMKTDTATLTGDVVLTQGKNVLKGPELVVNMKTGIAKIVGGTSGLFIQDSSKSKQN